MAVIRPFRALRPASEAAAAVSSVPYDVVSTDEARQLAASKPLSFLHVTRSEIDLPPGTDPYSADVYARAKANLASLRSAAPLVEEDEPSLYFYRLRMGGHEQTGVAACFSIDEYERDVIKKHERTRRDKEDDRTRHIVETRAQTGVVFLTYKASEGIDRLCRAVTSDAPIYDFRADDGVQHTIWRVGARESTSLVDGFAQIPAIYIADGHHRAASAARARGGVRGGRGGGGAGAAMAVRRTRSSRWRFPTTRCRSSPTTAPSRTWPAGHPRPFSMRCAQPYRSAKDGPSRAARGKCPRISTAGGMRSISAPSRPRIDPARRASTSRACSTTCSGRCFRLATCAPTSASISSAACAA